MAEQNQIEKQDVEGLQRQQHDEVAGKKLPEAEALFRPVQSGIDEREHHQRDGEDHQLPAQPTRAGKALARAREDRRLHILRRGGEKALVLNEGHGGPEHQEQSRHQNERQDHSHEHSRSSSYYFLQQKMPSARTELTRTSE